MKLATTDLASALIPVTGSTHTVHWATQNEAGRLWSLCASGEIYGAAPFNVEEDADATCTNCTKIAQSPEALLSRFASDARTAASNRFERH